MSAVHRDGDSRTCGASTVAQGQSTVYVNGKLCAVSGDPNTHGAGNLIPSSSTVYVGGLLIIVNSPDSASPDALCPTLAGAHCAPSTSEGSPNVNAN